MSPLSWIFILSLNIFLFNLSFKKVVPLAIALEEIALEKADKKLFAILLSNTIFNFSLLIFLGFNLFNASSAALAPKSFGLRMSS